MRRPSDRRCALVTIVFVLSIFLMGCELVDAIALTFAGNSPPSGDVDVTTLRPEDEEDVPLTPEYDNHNSAAVYNNGTPATLEFDEPIQIDSIQTYHWNDGAGSPQTGQIWIQAEDGTVYGPWDTAGSEGQGGVPNAYWTASPGIELPPGNYTVMDSDPATWSQNSRSQGEGMVRIYTEAE